MKVCFIGNCGHSAQAYKVLKARSDIQLCGFAPSCQREGINRSPFDGVEYYPSYTEMLDRIKPDLAIVSPIFGLTASVIIQCAQREINVFSEKPIATTLEQLEAVKDAVKTHNIRFCAMHYLRYVPAFYHAARMVRSGAIGDVRMLTAQKSYKWGTRPEWYADKELYGGTIPWVGIHAIDWIYAFTGKRFLSVCSESYGSPGIAALCQFKMEDRIIAAINLDYLRPGVAPSHGDDRIRCVGKDGIIEVIDDRITLMNCDGVQQIEPKNAPELLTEFLSDGEFIPTDELFHITKAAICARDAAESSKSVAII